MAKKTILLADDVQFFLELEKTLFRREDFNLITAVNGYEVLEKIAVDKPDLVLLDLCMPGMNGDECCRHIKSAPETCQIPVIMVTASGREEDLLRCRQAGCDDIILKPINREYFIETARKHLKLRDCKHVRYKARLQIHFGKDEKELLSDYAINLSTGGVFLETVNLMSEDTPLSAEFVLPHCDLTIRCKARVAWVNHPDKIKNRSLPVGMGIHFVNLSTEGMDAIRSYIKEECLLPLW